MKNISGKLLLSLLLLLPFAGLRSQSFFNTRGTRILGPDGKPFQLRGTNLGNWLMPEGYMFLLGDVNSPRLINRCFSELLGPDETASFWKEYLDNYITEEDIHYLKSIGVNSIRVPFNYRLFTNETYLGSTDSTRGFHYLDRLVSWCRKEKLYLVLDMHAAPGGQTGDNIDDGYGYPFLFESPASQQLCIRIWKRIAKHYSQEKIIIGYDLLNEPIAHYFDKERLNPLLEPLYKRMTAAIREVDRNHLLFLGGAQWDSNFKPFGPPFDSKLVYSFHKYWTPPTRQVIQEYIDFSNKYQVPIYCGETGENEDAWIDSFRLVLDSFDISWHFWPYKKIESTRGIVRFDPPAYYDSVVAYAKKPRRNFAEIRKARPADMQEIRKALQGYLHNCRFRNCHENSGYIRALGFRPLGS